MTLLASFTDPILRMVGRKVHYVRGGQQVFTVTRRTKKGLCEISNGNGKRITVHPSDVIPV